MKTRAMLYLVLGALFVFVGNSFVMGEAEKPSEIGASEKYDEIIAPQGTEGINENTFYGYLAGNGIMTGVYNTFIGAHAGNSNGTGHRNTFIGVAAGFENSTGPMNTFMGYGAGYKNTSGGNSFFGTKAGYGNTTGYNNCVFGNEAGYTDSIGNSNSFFGWRAGYNNSYGSLNTFFGLWAGFSNTTGSSNTCFGTHAGYFNKTGSGNVFLGYHAGSEETDSDNKLYIHNTLSSTPLIWGDFDARKVVINGDFRAIAIAGPSDQRWKKNIQSLESSLEKVSNLQGVSYEWKIEEYPDVGMTEGKQIGLIAQDVEKELPELVSEDKDGYKAVSYSKLTAVLVEAVKELNEQNEKQQAEIEQLRALIKDSNLLTFLKKHSSISTI